MSDMELPTAWKPFVTPDPSAPPAKKTLITKLSEVMASVDRIAKRGHNEHFHYDFATESDITAAIRGELASRHVMIVPFVESLTWREVPTRTGSNSVCCAMVKFDVYDGESTDALTFRIPGEGQDAGDKCVPKALTSAVKYALLKLFLIPTGDDPEIARKDEKTPKPARPTNVPVDLANVTRGKKPVSVPDGAVAVVEVQAGTWGSAIGQAVLVDSTGVEGKFAIFNPGVLNRAQDAARSGWLARAELKTPKNGKKAYLNELVAFEVVL